MDERTTRLELIKHIYAHNPHQKIEKTIEDAEKALKYVLGK